MSAVARYLARVSWWFMLRVMRQPWMKRLQRRWLLMVREHKREAAWASVCRQNKFARRYGLTMLTVSYNLLLASILVTWVFFLLLDWQEKGYLAPLDEQRRYSADR